MEVEHGPLGPRSARTLALHLIAGQSGISETRDPLARERLRHDLLSDALDGRSESDVALLVHELSLIASFLLESALSEERFFHASMTELDALALLDEAWS
jgi:hypothetical protein